MQVRRSQKRIYVGNISKRSDKHEIKKMFDEIGPLANFVFYENEDEAYIEYGTHEEA